MVVGKLLYGSFKFNSWLLIKFISSKWLLLYTRLIYSEEPDPYIATLPEPNNERLVFESMAAYKPVLGVTPATDGSPIVAVIVPIAAVFAPVVTTVVPNNVSVAAIAFEFPCICKPCPSIVIPWA